MEKSEFVKLLRETADIYEAGANNIPNTDKPTRDYLVGMASGLRIGAKLAERNLVTEPLNATETIGRAENANE